MSASQSESQRSTVTAALMEPCALFLSSGALNAPLPPFSGDRTKDFPEVIAWVTSVLRLRCDVTEDLSQVWWRHIQAWPKPDFLLSHHKVRCCDSGCWCDYLSSQTELQSSKQEPTTLRRENLRPTTTSEEKKANLNKETDLFILDDDSKPEWWHHYSRPKGRLVQMKQRSSLILCSFSRFSGITFCKSQILNGSKVFLGFIGRYIEGTTFILSVTLPDSLFLPNDGG